MLAAVGSSALFAFLVVIGRTRPRNDLSLVVVVLLGVGAATVAVVASGLGIWENAGFVGVTGAAAGLGWARLRRAERRCEARPATRIAALIAITVAGATAAVVLVHIWRPPVDLEYATVDLRDRAEPVSGIYLTLTDDDLYLAPATKCDGEYRTHRRVVVLPRSRVLRITLRRKAHVRDGGLRGCGSTH